MRSYEKKQLIYKFILVLVFVACITVVITVYATFNCMDSNYISVTEEDITENTEENIDTIASALKSFRKLIDEYYIGDIDEQKMLDATIKGYVNGLEDVYSEYMTAEEWEEFQIEALGNYVGIGIYMTQDALGNIVVLEPIEQSPAEAVGLKPNDIIAEVEGEDVKGKDISIVSSKIKGDPGTYVRLKLIRDNQYVTVDVERKEIKMYHVKSEMLENNIGYIKLSTFDEACSDEFKKCYEDLKAKGAQKLIIDLRNNTGGLVEEALNIADMILPKDKKILITVDSKENKKTTFSLKDPIVDMDIVVIVNENSASASEILVGALKDNDEAEVVGTKTYGKGIIQEVFTLSDGSMLKLTTAEYFTPNETQIHKKGIEPDLLVELVQEPEGKEEIDEQLNKAIEILNKK